MIAGLGALVRRGVGQPIARPVAADDAAFLARKGAVKIAFRVLRRSVEMAASGQRRQERNRIDPAWRRVLWIHTEAPQIGDALMDLAPRSLLVANGLEIDLLAPPTTAALFMGDRDFGRVFVDEAEVEPARYDAVIADSRSWKALAAKRVRLSALPWVSIKGDYLGYDYHRGLLAARRLGELLGVTLDDAAERLHSRQKLLIDEPGVATRSGRVALALGGVRVERSYAHWPEVATQLRGRGIERFVLIGSANGTEAAAMVNERLRNSGADVLDLVARTDLHGTWRAIAGASAVACADGGLMHLALATPTPVVALFDAGIDPAWRLPLVFDGLALRSDLRDVSAIDATRVAAAVVSARR